MEGVVDVESRERSGSPVSVDSQPRGAASRLAVPHQQTALREADPRVSLREADRLTIDHIEPDRLASLREAVGEYRTQSRATSTVSYYQRDWDAYDTWCRQMGLLSLPVDPEQVSLYIAALAEQVKADGTHRHKASSIRRYVSSIAHMQYLTGGGRGLGSHEAIAETVAGVARLRQESVSRKRALSLDEIKQVIEMMGSSTESPGSVQWPYPIAIARDRLAVLMGLVTGMRRAEIAALRIGEVEAKPSKGLQVTLRRSKTDQLGHGQLKAVPYGTAPMTCVPCHHMRWLHLMAAPDRVAALRLAREAHADAAWKRHHICRGRQPDLDPRAPLLRAVNKAGVISQRALSATSLNAAFKRRLAEAGFDPGPYGFHSLRASFVTIARENGASVRDVARQTTQSAEIVAVYDRTNDIFKDNAANHLGL